MTVVSRIAFLLLITGIHLSCSRIIDTNRYESNYRLDIDDASGTGGIEGTMDANVPDVHQYERNFPTFDAEDVQIFEDVQNPEDTRVSIDAQWTVDAPSIEGGGSEENDSAVDLCPDDPFKTEPGICGCGESDIDSDKDGIVDCTDPCPGNANVACECDSDDDCDMEEICICEAPCDGEAYKCQVVACMPGEKQVCGNCETGMRACQDNGLWGECEGEDGCISGTTEPCDKCGIRTCQTDCAWSSCENQGVCTPNEVSRCGKCNKGTRICQNNCQWGACEGDGECSPGETAVCGNCNAGEMVCNQDCTWGDCIGEECVPGIFNYQACGNCGIQYCNSTTCRWGSCINQGVCTPNSQQSCGNCSSGTQVCNDLCQWNYCIGEKGCTPFLDSRPCGPCDSGTQHCNLQCDWSPSCTLPHGVCDPDTAYPEPCGACGEGTRKCTTQCTWDEECEGQGCTPGDEMLCQDPCEKRVCTNCRWSDCQPTGECDAGAG